jgi:hypothetical protein
MSITITIPPVAIPGIASWFPPIAVNWKRALRTLLSLAEPALVFTAEEAGLGPAAPLVVGAALTLTRRALLAEPISLGGV